MMPGEVERKLYKLSKGKVRIFCGDDKTKPAGVYYLEGSEYVEICGIDKNDVPERRQMYLDGRIRKGGWRRVLKILIQRKLIDRREAERAFHTHLAFAPFDAVQMQADPVAQLLAKAKQRSVEKLMSQKGVYNPHYMDLQELMDMRDAKKTLRKQGEIL